MVVTKTKLAREEIARLGDQLFESRIVPVVGPGDAGRYVVIDVATGDYEIDMNELVASDRLRTRRPNAEIWLRQIGSRYARRFGIRPGANST